MKQRRLGKQGLVTSSVGLGCMNLTLGAGTTKPHRLDENAAAAEILLDANDLAGIEEAFPPDQVAGERYDRQGFSMIES